MEMLESLQPDSAKQQEYITAILYQLRDHQLQGAGVVVEGDGEEEGLELHKYEDVGWDVPGGFPRGI
ncbi:hypothetical protein Tco_1098786, partial [Tanacetum coccineum]